MPKSEKSDARTNPLKGNKKLDAALAKIRKKYGEAAVRTANTIPPVRRLPTGIFALDIALGVSTGEAGYAEGRITVIPGAESSCKTTTTLMAIATAQGWGWPTALISAEPFDPEWAAAQGVDLERLFIESSQNTEQSLDILCELIRNMPRGLIVLDSLAALTPKDEQAASFFEWQQGLAARLNNKGFRVMQAGQNYASNRDYEEKLAAHKEEWKKKKNPPEFIYDTATGSLGPTVLVVQQFRESIKSSAKVMPGGNGQLFAASTICNMRPGKKIYHIPGKGPQTEYPKDMSKAIAVGRYFHFDVVKNKTSPAYQVGDFVLYTMNYDDPDTGHSYRSGTTNYYEQVERIATMTGAWHLRGSYRYLNDPDNEKPICNGADAAVEALREDPDLLDVIIERIYAAADLRARQPKEIA